MPQVLIPASLRSLTDGVQSVEVQATTVREVIEELETRFPGISKRLLSDGKLTPGLSVAIDSRIHGHGLLEKVAPDSEVTFVPSVSGG